MVANFALVTLYFTLAWHRDRERASPVFARLEESQRFSIGETVASALFLKIDYRGIFHDQDQ